MAAVRTGGEIDSICTKCKMVLAHTVIAMVGSKPVRVQCNTCGGQHQHRSATPTEAKKTARVASAATASRTTRVSPIRLSFDDMLAQRKTGLSKPYSPKTRFLLDEVMTHPTFGMGFVSEVKPDKIEVTFRSGMKILVHGRG